MQSRQTGVTLFGFVVILIVVAFFAFMAMKLVPPYVEYFGVSKAMQQVAEEKTDGKSQHDIRQEFMFKLNFQYADQVIKPKDIVFTHANGVTSMNVAYDQHVHFIYNIDFLLHFQKNVQLQGRLY